MGIKGFVLGRQEGFDDPPRHGFHRHENTPLAGVFGQKASVGRMHPGDHRWLIGGQIFIVRQVASEFVKSV